MSQIYIYSGPVHSGKTSQLATWSAKTNSVDGILAPVIDGKRYIKFLSDCEQYLLECDTSDSDQLQEIGRYKLSTEIFHKAQKYLLDLSGNCPEWIIVDEIGPLELSGKGLEPAISRILSQLNKNKKVKIILVIRKQIVERAIKYFKLNPGEIRNFIPENQ